jgi:hypothetical protein
MTIESPIFIVAFQTSRCVVVVFVCPGALTSAVVLFEQAAIAATSKTVAAVLK